MCAHNAWQGNVACGEPTTNVVTVMQGEVIRISQCLDKNYEERIVNILRRSDYTDDKAFV